MSSPTNVRLVALVCLLAALATQVNLSLGEFIPQWIQRETDGWRNTEREEKPQKVWLDAFDEKKCGDANLRPWQRKQRAFGCDPSESSSPYQKNYKATPIFGMPANEGEFPFYVRIRASGASDKRSCSGILVSKDVVITTGDQCLFGDFDSVYLRFGSNKEGGEGEVQRRAKKWCTSTVINTDAGELKEDLAIILLDKPVDYVPGVIGPACMRRPLNTTVVGSLEPSGQTTCTLAASCQPLAPDTLTRPWLYYPPPGDSLRSIAFKPDRCRPGHRIPVGRQCYIGADYREVCDGDIGAPVICYDKCSKKNKDKVQAYVVGILSSQYDDDEWSSARIVIDYQRNFVRLILLLKAARYGDDNFETGTLRCRSAGRGRFF